MATYSLSSLADIESYYGEGLRSFLKGDLVRAAQSFTRCTQDRLDLPLGWHFLSKVLSCSGRASDAEVMRQKTHDLCRSILERAGSNPLVASLKKGITALSRRKPWEALHYFGQFFEQNPGATAAWVYVGLLLEDCNLIPEALFCFTQGFSQGILECGIILDQLSGVRGFPKNFLGLTTESYKASVIARYYNTAKGRKFIELMADRQHEVIARHHEEYLAWNPNSYLIQSGILTALFALKRNDEAIKLARDFVEKDPVNPDKLSALAIANFGIKSVDAGIHAIQDAIRLDPTRSHEWGQLADLYVSLEDFPRAEHTITWALFWQPMNAGFWQTLADVYSHLGLNDLSTLARRKFVSLTVLGSIVPGLATSPWDSRLLLTPSAKDIEGAFWITDNENHLKILGSSVPDAQVFSRFTREIGLSGDQFDPRMPEVFRIVLVRTKDTPLGRGFEPFNLYVLAHLALSKNPRVSRGALSRILGIGINRVSKIIDLLKQSIKGLDTIP